jgi:hypothetical protein
MVPAEGRDHLLVGPQGVFKVGNKLFKAIIFWCTNIQVFPIRGKIAMFPKKLITISIAFIFAIIFSSCNQNREEKAAERYRDMVKSSTGKTISVSEAMEMLKNLEDRKIVKSDEIEQALNLLKAKYDYKIFPPEELQGKMIFSFIIKDYLMNDEKHILFVGQLDDITNEEGQFTIHFFSQLQLSDWRGRKRAHFHLRSPVESIESIIQNPPAEPQAFTGFQKQYFVICKISDLNKVTSNYQINSDIERIGSEILVDTPTEYQIEGDLVEIIPYPK